MRTYYLFLIKRDVNKIYKENKVNLYKTLENLYLLKKSNYKYGLSIYNQLCDYIDIKILNNYFQNKKYHRYQNNYYYKYKDEKTLILIKKSCIIIKTNVNIPYIFKIFNYYNPYFFICDFKNKDYFWLKDNYNKNKIIEYI